jgi:hypothetical protein
MAKLSNIKSPVGLATFGAFFVPEPLGVCLVVASGIWWLSRTTALTRLFSGDLARAKLLAQMQYAGLLALGTCAWIGSSMVFVN